MSNNRTIDLRVFDLARETVYNAIEEKKRQIVKHGEELRMKLVLHKLEQNLRLEARKKAFEKLKETMDNLDINSPDFNEKNNWISGELKRLKEEKLVLQTLEFVRDDDFIKSNEIGKLIVRDMIQNGDKPLEINEFDLDK
jgi:hypothetical protein